MSSEIEIDKSKAQVFRERTRAKRLKNLGKRKLEKRENWDEVREKKKKTCERQGQQEK